MCHVGAKCFSAEGIRADELQPCEDTAMEQRLSKDEKRGVRKRKILYLSWRVSFLASLCLFTQCSVPVTLLRLKRSSTFEENAGGIRHALHSIQ